jgi:hypothetical protein
VGGVRDPRRLVQRHADQPGLRPTDLADVNAHADADVACLGPLVRCDAELRVEGGGHGLLHVPEHSEERVTLRVDVPAPVRGDRVSQDPMVDVEQVGVRVPDPLEQGCRALDVGEEEGLVSEWLHGGLDVPRRRVGAESGVELLVAARTVTTPA